RALGFHRDPRQHRAGGVTYGPTDLLRTGRAREKQDARSGSNRCDKARPDPTHMGASLSAVVARTPWTAHPRIGEPETSDCNQLGSYRRTGEVPTERGDQVTSSPWPPAHYTPLRERQTGELAGAVTEPTDR